MFITFDGIDGSGKSTQIALICDHLLRRGFAIERLRDPGSTPLGEAVREILLHRQEIPLDARSEMLLYMSCRAQLVAEQIRPALASGKVVVCDRFLLANVVYQGYGGGLDPESLWQVGAIATGGLQPDLTVVLDLPVAVASQRVGATRDRLESRGAEYFERVRQGFLAEAHRGSVRAVVVDATQSIEAMHAQIADEVETLFGAS